MGSWRVPSYFFDPSFDFFLNAEAAENPEKKQKISSKEPKAITAFEFIPSVFIGSFVFL